MDLSAAVVGPLPVAGWFAPEAEAEAGPDFGSGPAVGCFPAPGPER